jgi:hypothetical protein
MNSYSTMQTSKTACTLVVYGILASQGLAHADAPKTTPQGLSPLPYETHANTPSFGQLGNLYNGYQLQAIDQEFVGTVSNFYAQLLDNQEPLGQEFEQVLHDNLWELYES